ncbi:MAG: lipopolysaccharide heptosyltransferase I [Burkholderiales bacterium]|nr:lipopolysaccharide heptosyltransferase I [Burkholderiales bacterium]
MRVLLVKLSSMGDVLHNLPVVCDLVHAYPEIELDWVTEAPYTSLVALHPRVRRIISTNLRGLKKRWWSAAAWSGVFDVKAQLAGEKYNLILDTQGLIKSALIARWANGPIGGFSRDTVREPLAARAYDRRIAVPRNLHAVVRNRNLAAGIFGYEVAGPADYGLRLPTTPASVPIERPYVVFLHATSRVDKMWPEAHWIALGQRLHECGWGVLLPWGNTEEKCTSDRLAKAIPGAVVPPMLSLVEAAILLAGARGVIGVDTGLAHLSVALARPTVGLYLTTSPALTGLYGNDLAINLGGGTRQHPGTPNVEEVWQAFQLLLGRK